MGNEDLYTDKELFEQIAIDNEQAFTILFNRWKHRVFTIAQMHTENQFRSEEIVQDVFLKIWMNRAKLPAIQMPDNWIYRIARNHALNILKQMARDPQMQDQELSLYPSPGQGSPFQEAELNALLEKGLKLLSPQQRKVFELSRLEKQSREEIAVAMGISKATVSVHLTIALRVMRAFFIERMDIISLILLLKTFF